MVINIIEYYCVFAAATSITSYLTLYRPVLLKVKNDIGDDFPMIQMPILTACILFSLGFIGAPFLLALTLKGLDEELENAILDIIVKGD